ncbi:MAG: WbqC family protein [Defluviitaleaceae bacterium]|nr:WbqC family protein [Defluviitaleaceae bacterium]
MILSGHQISYIPWLPYFDKIIKSDVFVIDDTSQFEKGGYSNRNLIKTSQGKEYLTVPINYTNYKEQKLNQIKIAKDENWRRKHYRMIQCAYGKSPYFHKYNSKLQTFYSYDTENLSDFCRKFLEFILIEINIGTKIVYSSELKGLVGKKSDFVLSLCRSLNATIYYSGKQGINYLDIEKFKYYGIEVIFQDYKFKTYSKKFGKFESGLSIIDLMMNHGEKSIDFI